MELDLSQKHVLVCGATGGIGRATAIKFAQAGANVTLLARNQEKLHALTQQLSTTAQQTHDFIAADGSNTSTLNDQLKQYLQQNNNFDIIVNNSGGPAPGPAHQANAEQYTQAFAQHLLCNQTIVQAAVESMKAKKFGRIINVISTSVKQPIAGLGVSNTVRGAVANWAKTLAGELGPFGITVNNVLPGATDTQRLAEIFENKAKKQNLSIEQIKENELQSIPLRRFAQADDIANSIIFLASAAGAYINGINLPVDGGRTSCL